MNSPTILLVIYLKAHCLQIVSGPFLFLVLLCKAQTNIADMRFPEMYLEPTIPIPRCRLQGVAREGT
jgi:hypothetical protein